MTMAREIMQKNASVQPGNKGAKPTVVPSAAKKDSKGCCGK